MPTLNSSNTERIIKRPKSRLLRVSSYGEHPAMIIDLPRGKRVSIFAAASPALVAAALKGLR